MSSPALPHLQLRRSSGAADDVPADPQARRRLIHALGFHAVLVVAAASHTYALAATDLHRFVFPAVTIGLALYFVYLLRVSTGQLRMLFLVGMFVCGFGENFLVYGLDLYHFSPSMTAPYAIPPYVIMGHGYAIWTAVVLRDGLLARVSTGASLRWLVVACALTFATRAIAHRDVLGAIWILFFVAAYFSTPHRPTRVLYCVTFLLTTSLELVGVGLRAWDWHAHPYFWTLEWPMLNPPSAVGAFYVVGDMLTLMLVRYIVPGADRGH